jgi:hypothetical protein
MRSAERIHRADDRHWIAVQQRRSRAGGARPGQHKQQHNQRAQDSPARMKRHKGPLGQVMWDSIFKQPSNNTPNYNRNSTHKTRQPGKVFPTADTYSRYVDCYQFVKVFFVVPDSNIICLWVIRWFQGGKHENTFIDAPW